MPLEMTNEELDEHSRSWWLPAFVLKYAWLALPLVLIGALVAGALHYFLLYFLGCMLLVAVRILVELPQAPYRDERNYRRWQKQKALGGRVPPHPRWIYEQMTSPTPPEQVLILRGALLPAGGHFWIAVQLRGAGAHLEAHHDEMVRNEELAPADLAALREHLTAAAQQRRHESLPSQVVDGVPVHFERHQRGTPTPLLFDCNLASPSQHPTQRLCDLLYELGTRHLTAPPRYAATGPGRQISIRGGATPAE